MTLLGFRLEEDLKYELESNFENELRFAENVSSFMELLKERRYEAIVIDETDFQREMLINIIKKLESYIKKQSLL